MRDAEHLHRKVSDRFHSRTVLLVESSLFSDTVSTEDAVLNDQTVEVLGPETADSLRISFDLKGEFADIGELFFEGEQVICKTPRLTDSRDEVTNMRRLHAVAREYKILKIADNHQNIVKPLAIGIVKYVPSLFLVYSGSTTLFKYLQENESIFQRHASNILRGVGNGIAHLHNCSIIHFNVKSSNIVLKKYPYNVHPVLVGFSLACREEASKPLTRLQQKKFADAMHIPHEVKIGKSRPSYPSDTYAYGMLSRHMLIKLDNGILKDRLRSFIFKCTDTTSSQRPVHGDFLHGFEFVCDI